MCREVIWRGEEVLTGRRWWVEGEYVGPAVTRRCRRFSVMVKEVVEVLQTMMDVLHRSANARCSSLHDVGGDYRKQMEPTAVFHMCFRSIQKFILLLLCYYNLLNTSSTTSSVFALPPISGVNNFPSSKLPSTAL